MKKRLIVLLALVVSAIMCVPAYNSTAQQVAKPIQVGEPVIDQLKGSAEAKYSFSGKAGEYYAVTFQRGSKSKVSATISILDSTGKPVYTYSLLSAQLVQLPTDGNYNITVKRKDAATGEFVLRLYRVTQLESAKPVDAEITSHWFMDKDLFIGTHQYFVIQSDSDIRVTVKIGERTSPPRVTAPIMCWISQPGLGVPDSHVHFNGEMRNVVAFDATLKGNPNFYVLELLFNGYGRVGNPVGDEILTQKFTVMAEK
jgi:hypothetical protein